MAVETPLSLALGADWEIAFLSGELQAAEFRLGLRSGQVLELTLGDGIEATEDGGLVTVTSDQQDDLKQRVYSYEIWATIGGDTALIQYGSLDAYETFRHIDNDPEPRPLSGAAAGVGAAAGALEVQGSADLSGAAAGVGAASGDLQAVGVEPLAGAASGQGAAGGLLSAVGVEPLAGAAAGVGAAAGEITTVVEAEAINLAGGAAGQGDAQGETTVVPYAPQYLPTNANRVEFYAPLKVTPDSVYSGPLFSVCAPSDTSATPATPMDVYPLGGTGADQQFPDLAAAFTAFGATLNVWKEYCLNGSGRTRENATAGKRPVIRAANALSGYKQPVTYGWANTDLSPDNANTDIDMGMANATGSYDRRDHSQMHVVIAGTAGGLAQIFGGVGSASTAQWVTQMFNSGTSPSAGNFALRGANSGALNGVTSTLLTNSAEPCIVMQRTSATQIIFNVNDEKQVVASAPPSGTATGVLTGTDANNAALGAYFDWFGSGYYSVGTLTDEEVTAEMAPFKALLDINVSTARQLVLTPHSNSVHGNKGVRARPPFRQVHETGSLTHRYKTGIIGISGRSIQEQRRGPLDWTSKYDASATRYVYEVGGIMNDSNKLQFVATTTNGSPNLSFTAGTLPPWVVASLCVLSGTGITAGTGVSSTDNAGGTLVMSANATASGTVLVTCGTNGSLSKTVTATTTANNPVVLVSDTTNLMVGCTVACANIPTTTLIASIQPGVSITMASGTGITAATGVNLTTGDQSLVTPCGQWLYDNVITPYVTDLKAQGSNVRVLLNTGYNFLFTTFTAQTGVTNSNLEKSIRNQITAATNEAIYAGYEALGAILVDDGGALGIASPPAAISPDGVHLNAAGINTYMVPNRVTALNLADVA